MILQSFSLKTDCTNKFSIPKLCEKSSFQVSNSTHDNRNNYQVIFTFIENTGNSLQNTVMMKNDEIISFSLKTDYTNTFSIPKLSENSLFQVSNYTHDDRNNYQVTFTFIENP